ncbi:MAG: alkyl sulfatase dimerization domain-containing protein [Halioglobus sp.]
MKISARYLLLLATLGLTACGESAKDSSIQVDGASLPSDSAWSLDEYQGKPATAATKASQDKAEGLLPAGDFLDGSMMKAHSKEELIARLPAGVGALDVNEFSFVDDERPDEIHPGVFIDMRERSKNSGLYKLDEGVYQIRGDLAHITLVRGDRGWIVLDAGTTRQFAGDSWSFARELLPGGRDVPISAVVYSHSHVDHFGGVKGLITQADVDEGRVEVIAPYAFMGEALAENVIAGSAMLRRANYHFGSNLSLKSDGTELFYMNLQGGDFTLIAPTVELPAGRGVITERVVDGVDILFKDISSAEAPSATLIYLPQKKLLFNSELMFKGLHNVYTLRGALVRDALGWSKLINEVIQEFGADAEMITGPHGPTFSGNEKIVEYMTLQRDNYGFIHNQALRLINSGMKLQDVGRAVESMIPSTLASVWHTRGYHGTYSHNARGVVNRYLGFYDGNPANLNPLPLKVEAEKFVEYMGGPDNIMANARRDFDQGNYQFVTTAVNKLVTAEPDNWPARHLLADAYEQLGYQSEGPQWRNAYLTAAKEMRIGQVLEPGLASDQKDLLAAATVPDVLDSLAVKVNAQDADGKSILINLVLPDSQEQYAITLANGNLTYYAAQQLQEADVTLTIDQQKLLELISGQLSATELLSLGTSAFQGSPLALASFLSVIDKDNRNYDLVPMPSP